MVIWRGHGDIQRRLLRQKKGRMSLLIARSCHSTMVMVVIVVLNLCIMMVVVMMMLLIKLLRLLMLHPVPIGIEVA